MHTRYIIHFDKDRIGNSIGTADWFENIILLGHVTLHTILVSPEYSLAIVPSNSDHNFNFYPQHEIAHQIGFNVVSVSVCEPLSGCPGPNSENRKSLKTDSKSNVHFSYWAFLPNIPSLPVCWISIYVQASREDSYYVKVWAETFVLVEILRQL